MPHHMQRIFERLIAKLPSETLESRRHKMAYKKCWITKQTSYKNFISFKNKEKVRTFLHFSKNEFGPN